MHWIIGGLIVIVIFLLVFIEYLWTQFPLVREENLRLVVDEGRHEGEDWGSPSNPVKRICNPGDVFFTNIYTGDRFLRVQRIKVIEIRGSQVYFEVTVWNDERGE